LFDGRVQSLSLPALMPVSNLPGPDVELSLGQPHRVVTSFSSQGR